MSDRIVDPTRQGGEQMQERGHANQRLIDPPAPRTLGQPKMTFAEAHEYLDGMEWRKVRTRSHRALEAMAKEVDRLREMYEWVCNLSADGHNQRDILRDERDRLIAAIPEITGCPLGDGSACVKTTYPWTSCCRTRLALVRLGIIPASERATESEGDA